MVFDFFSQCFKGAGKEGIFSVFGLHVCLLVAINGIIQTLCLLFFFKFTWFFKTEGHIILSHNSCVPVFSLYKNTLIGCLPLPDL